MPKTKKFLGVETNDEIAMFAAITKNGDYYDYRISFVNADDCRSTWIAESVKSLTVRAMSSREFNHVYAFRFETDTHFYNLESVGNMLGTLKKKLRAIEERHGEIKTIGQFFNAIALACGIEKIYWYNYVTGTKSTYLVETKDYARISKVGQFVSEFDYSVLDMTRDHEKPITGISIM